MSSATRTSRPPSGKAERWRAICAQRPVLTRDQIELVAALLRTMDQRRATAGSNASDDSATNGRSPAQLSGGLRSPPDGCVQR